MKDGGLGGGALCFFQALQVAIMVNVLLSLLFQPIKLLLSKIKIVFKVLACP